MHRKKRTALPLMLAALLAAFVCRGLDDDLAVRSYALSSEKLTGTVRLVFLSDLHSCDYGEGQRELLEMVAALEPDLVLLGGDWVDDDFGRLPQERAYDAARALAKRWPACYVTGNHEFWSGCADEIKVRLTGCGVMVLAGESITLAVRDQLVRICGLDDPAVGEKVWAAELDALKAENRADVCSVLLTHRPERMDAYGGFDLALAGHAHGGQWRLPGLVNGLIAPNQGVFPQYAGGSYALEGGGTLVVGRGLARESTRVPRFYNPPEVVCVDLVPAGT